MKMQRHEISFGRDTPSIAIGSGVVNGLCLALATAAVGALFTTIWQTGKLVGRPLGALATRLMPESETKQLSEPGAMRRVQSTLGGIFAALFCVIALMTNLVVLDRAEILGGYSMEWSWARFTVLILQSVLEGEVAMVLLAGLVRITGIS
jgi:hypothetical protein